MDPRRAPVSEPGRIRERRRTRKSERLGIMPGTVDEVVTEQDGDIVEHQ